MNKKITYLILGLLGFALVACFEDKGNYDFAYSNIKELNSQFPDNVVSVYLGDTIKIQPTITWVDPEADTLDYDYFYIFSGDTIGRERKLVFVPSTVGNKEGFLVVENRTNHLKSITNVSYYVASPFSSGWVILSEKNGTTDLSILAQSRGSYWLTPQDPGYVQYRDGDVLPEGYAYMRGILYKWDDHVSLYTTLHSDDPLGSKPISLSLGYVGYSTSYAEYVVMQENGGHWVLNANDFSKYYRFTDDFGSGVAGNFKPVRFMDAVSSHFMIGEDYSIYWRKVSSSIYDSRQCPWENLLYFGNNARITHVFDTHLYKLGAMLVYDAHNRRIIPITTVNQSMETAAANLLNITYSRTEAIPADFIQLGNTGDYNPVYVASAGGAADYNSSTLFMLFEKDDKLYVQRCYARVQYSSGYMEISRMVSPIEFPADGKVNKNSIYMKCKWDKDYLFAAEGSKLYFYEMSIPSRGLKLFKDYGSKIVKIVENPKSNQVGIALENGEFHIVGTYDRFFAGENLGDIATYHVTKDLGRIVDVIWKPSSFTGWAFGYDY